MLALLSLASALSLSAAVASPALPSSSAALSGASAVLAAFVDAVDADGRSALSYGMSDCTFGFIVIVETV
jgi:hypothetical protein